MTTSYRALVLTLLMSGTAASAEPPSTSVCYGTVSNGRIDGAVQLPLRGPNFEAYSALTRVLGRNYVHSTVAEIVLAAYAALELSQPEKTYVYGETGAAAGGPFPPHRTHENGLSVDFFVPVLDGAGTSTPLRTNMSNRFGYDIEFDAEARHGDVTIDFPAMAEHLFELRRAARARGVDVRLVIVTPSYLGRLLATPRGPALQALPFMKGEAWVRHDEHYHLDFSLPCRSR